MTQEEILEYNKRCAKFLGAIDNTHEWGFMLQPNELNLSFDLFDEKVFSNDEGSGWFVKDLKFHSDWNWIMEVVEAIEKKLDGSRPFKYALLDDLDFNIGNKSVKVKASFWTNPNTVNGNYWSYFKYNKKYNNISKKESVVQAINQFLIWYNEKTN